MRQLEHREPFDRLAVFFKNLSLGENGAALPEVEDEVKQKILALTENPEDCVWTRLLTPKDLQDSCFIFRAAILIIRCSSVAKRFLIALTLMIPQRIFIASAVSTMFTCADPAPTRAAL